MSLEELQTRWARESQTHPPRQRAKGREKEKKAEGELEETCTGRSHLLGCYSEDPKSCPCTLATCSMSSRQWFRFWSHELACKARRRQTSVHWPWDPLHGGHDVTLWTHISLYRHTYHFTQGPADTGMLPGQRLLCASQNAFLLSSWRPARQPSPVSLATDVATKSAFHIWWGCDEIIQWLFFSFSLSLSPSTNQMQKT